MAEEKQTAQENFKAQEIGKPFDFKNYQTPVLSAKHIQQFNFDFWIPSDCSSLDTVLELGCGTGQFLNYLKHKNVQEFLGIDQDPNLKEFIPPLER